MGPLLKTEETTSETAIAALEAAKLDAVADSMRRSSAELFSVDPENAVAADLSSWATRLSIAARARHPEAQELSPSRPSLQVL